MITLLTLMLLFFAVMTFIGMVWFCIKWFGAGLILLAFIAAFAAVDIAVVVAIISSLRKKKTERKEEEESQ